jgi:uncharacterized membrane protein
MNIENGVTKLFHRHHERYTPKDINKEYEEGLDAQDKIALYVTNAIGTMYAVYILSLVMIGWVLWQFFLEKKAFDPYPFAFLLFLGNIVQLLLMPLIMVGQNVQAKHAELRAEEQFRTTATSFNDIENIMAHLDAIDIEMTNQSKMLKQLLDKAEGGKGLL